MEQSQIEKLMKRPVPQSIKPIRIKLDKSEDDVEEEDKPLPVSRKPQIREEIDPQLTREELMKRLKGAPKQLPLFPETSVVERREPETKYDDINVKEVPISERVDRGTKRMLVAPDYYLNNREKFQKFISEFFSHYKSELSNQDDVTCATRSQSKSRELFTQQKIVRDYLNVDTPYKGLLLYHGLGSGKTCASIAVAEGLKTYKKIVVMTPASLKRGYLEQIKECGDPIYKLNQHWEFISLSGLSKEKKDKLYNYFKQVMGVSKEYIKKHKGAWMMNMKKPANYASLKKEDQIILNKQLNEMIQSKYTFIHYNGVTKKALNKMIEEEGNPFDNAVVIIDEVHNFVRLTLNSQGRSDAVASQLYNLMLTSDKSRFVFLSGTPIINKPCEIGIMFNILRGFINVYSFQVSPNNNRITEREVVSKLTRELKTVDSISYNEASRIITVTRNPYEFVNHYERNKKYLGMHREEGLDENIKKYKKVIQQQIGKIRYNGIKLKQFKLLPDTEQEFNHYFVGTNGELKNVDLLKRRIIGLTSYFRSSQEKLMPKYNRTTDFNVIKVPMGIEQTSRYLTAQDREKSIAQKKKDDDTGVYRIFTRTISNFAYPADLMDDEDAILEEIRKDVDLSGGDTLTKEYEVMKRLKDGGYLTPENLKNYSTKLLALLQQIQADGNKCGLIYSEFRKSYGIGIIQSALEVQGARQFKVKKNEKGEWILDMDDFGLFRFALFTGTENADEREIVRRVFNGEWDNVPRSLKNDILRMMGHDVIEEDEREDDEEERKEKIKDIKPSKKSKIILKSKTKKSKIVLKSKTKKPTSEKTNWLNEYLKSTSYKIVPTNPNGDCFFEVVTKAMKSLGREYTIDDLREILASEIDDNIFQTWKVSYEMHKDELTELESKEEKDSQTKKEIKNVKDLLQEFKFMEGIDTIDKLKEVVKTRKFWANVWAISTLERILNVKFIILSQKEYKDKNLKRILQCGELSQELQDIGTFEPDAYVIANYLGNHYELIEYRKKRTFTFDTLPKVIKGEIVKRCMTRDAGPFNIIPEFAEFKETRKRKGGNLSGDELLVNLHGEIIRLFMITAAGAEGVNLRNIQTVHIFEPYWNYVRLEQVIGRARRFCSHEGLPESERNVKVNLYLSVLPETEEETGQNELSTDEYLYELAIKKDTVNNKVLTCLKETAIDCTLYAPTNENIQCYTFDTPRDKENKLAYVPEIRQESTEETKHYREKTVQYKFKSAKIKGKQYAVKIDIKNPKNGVIYTLESYRQAQKEKDSSLLVEVGQMKNGIIIWKSNGGEE
jgi:hypothetical protein